MGQIFRRDETEISWLTGIGKPVLFAEPMPELVPSDAAAFALNGPLAEMLLKYPPEKRPDLAEDAVSELLGRSAAPLLLERYEMLFMPSYQLNVLKLLCSLARIRPLYTVWPGKITPSYLTYAELGDPDYKKYKISDFPIFCIL